MLPSARVKKYVRVPVPSAMRKVAAHAPQRMCMGLCTEASSQARMNGTRLGRCESTRSMTTLRGQGRITVKAASRIMATIAASKAVRWGRKRGRKHFQSRKECLGFFAPSARERCLGMTHLAYCGVLAFVRQSECSATLVDAEQAPAGARDCRQAMEDVIGALAFQNFGLVIYARIAVFDV